MKLFGQQISKVDLMKKIGNISQVAGVKEYTLRTGKAKNVDAIDVNAGDLRFTVLPSRALDIAWGSYKEYPFSYISKSGICSPEYYRKEAKNGFLENFFGGVLTTSGLNNIGSRCEVDGRIYGMHGDISNIPAEEISVRTYWEADEYWIKVSGKIRHSLFYAEDLIFEREITTKVGENKIYIKDSVENQDFKVTPFMLFYHFNFGYPFLDVNSQIISSPIVKTQARTKGAEEGIKDHASFIQPVDGMEEECFYHWFKPDENNKITCCLFNLELGENGLGIYIKYDADELPLFFAVENDEKQGICFRAFPCNQFCGRQEIYKPKRTKLSKTPLKNASIMSKLE